MDENNNVALLAWVRSQIGTIGHGHYQQVMHRCDHIKAELDQLAALISANDEQTHRQDSQINSILENVKETSQLCLSRSVCHENFENRLNQVDRRIYAMQQQLLCQSPVSSASNRSATVAVNNVSVSESENSSSRSPPTQVADNPMLLPRQSDAVSRQSDSVSRQSDSVSRQSDSVPRQSDSVPNQSDPPQRQIQSRSQPQCQPNQRQTHPLPQRAQPQRPSQPHPQRQPHPQPQRQSFPQPQRQSFPQPQRQFFPQSQGQSLPQGQAQTFPLPPSQISPQTQLQAFPYFQELDANAIPFQMPPAGPIPTPLAVPIPMPPAGPIPMPLAVPIPMPPAGPIPMPPAGPIPMPPAGPIPMPPVNFRIPMPQRPPQAFRLRGAYGMGNLSFVRLCDRRNDFGRPRLMPMPFEPRHYPHHRGPPPPGFPLRISPSAQQPRNDRFRLHPASAPLPQRRTDSVPSETRRNSNTDHGPGHSNQHAMNRDDSRPVQSAKAQSERSV